MSTTQQAFAAAQYGVRAQDYVTSAVYSQGADLDQMEAMLQGQGLSRALDLGCGGGHVSYRAAPHVAEVVACDVTAPMLDAVAATAAARGLGNITVQQAAAESLPFPDASFDVVLCRFTAHHWQDLEAGLRQARRVLKPGAPAMLIDSVAARTGWPTATCKPSSCCATRRTCATTAPRNWWAPWRGLASP